MKILKVVSDRNSVFVLHISVIFRSQLKVEEETKMASKTQADDLDELQKLELKEAFDEFDKVIANRL